MKTTDGRPDVYLLECKICPGHIWVGIISDIPRALGYHFNRHHPDRAQLLRQGVEYELDVAPMFCDICNIALGESCWTYRVPDPILPFDTDGNWAVCIECRPMVEAKDMDGLRQRKERIGAVQHPFFDDRSRARGIVAWKHCVRAFLAVCDGGVYGDTFPAEQT